MISPATNWVAFRQSVKARLDLPTAVGPVMTMTLGRGGEMEEVDMLSTRNLSVG